jgi:hypothetical protein
MSYDQRGAVQRDRSDDFVPGLGGFLPTPKYLDSQPPSVEDFPRSDPNWLLVQSRSVVPLELGLFGDLCIPAHHLRAQMARATNLQTLQTAIRSNATRLAPASVLLVARRTYKDGWVDSWCRSPNESLLFLHFAFPWKKPTQLHRGRRRWDKTSLPW